MRMNPKPPLLLCNITIAIWTLGLALVNFYFFIKRWQAFKLYTKRNGQNTSQTKSTKLKPESPQSLWDLEHPVRGLPNQSIATNQPPKRG